MTFFHMSVWLPLNKVAWEVATIPLKENSCFPWKSQAAEFIKKITKKKYNIKKKTSLRLISGQIFVNHYG